MRTTAKAAAVIGAAGLLLALAGPVQASSRPTVSVQQLEAQIVIGLPIRLGGVTYTAVPHAAGPGTRLRRCEDALTTGIMHGADPQLGRNTPGILRACRGLTEAEVTREIRWTLGMQAVFGPGGHPKVVCTTRHSGPVHTGTPHPVCPPKG
jgi:hypothetical protein